MDAFTNKDKYVDVYSTIKNIYNENNNLSEKETLKRFGLSEAKMTDAEVLSAAKRLYDNDKDEKAKSFGKGLIDFYEKNKSFTPNQVAGLQNIMKNVSFHSATE